MLPRALPQVLPLVQQVKLLLGKVQPVAQLSDRPEVPQLPLQPTVLAALECLALGGRLARAMAQAGRQLLLKSAPAHTPLVQAELQQRRTV